MTKQEAKEAMRKGKKVTHVYFTPEEWVTLKGHDSILLEDGVNCSESEFWRWRVDPMFDTGWEIWKPKK